MATTERVEILREYGSEAAKLSTKKQKSLQLAIATFAFAYIASHEARIRGLTMDDYKRMAEAVAAADSCRKARELEGADAEEGLELMLRLQGCAKQDKGYIAPTRRGDAAIMYAIGSAMKNDGRNN